MRALLLAASLLAGCVQATTFHCADDGECGAGRCEAAGVCSFADPGCPSGWRYGELSGAVADQCVQADDDAGLADAPPGAPDAAPDATVEPPVGWWDPAYAFRRKISVQNLAAEVLPDGYQVDLVVDLDTLGALDADYDDVRVMAQAGAGSWVQLARVIDVFSTPDEHLWFGMDGGIPIGATDDHVYLYYGNPAPTTSVADNPYSLWIDWAPFDAMDSSLTWSGADAVVSGGELRLFPDTTLWTNEEWPLGSAVDAVARVPTWSNGHSIGLYDRNDEEHAAIRGNGVYRMQPYYDPGQGSGGGNYNGANNTIDPSPHLYSVERTANTLRWRIDGVLVGIFAPKDPAVGDAEARLVNESTESMYFDFMRVRQVLDPPPEVTLGPEESAP